ncbi:exopolyphosphatase/guanosine-5'-triphosphate,3'-diphosphate pyrophosphatase [Novosphingobium kunmingense]|uniref:Exopolyphosphatase/guanosine-5'-triphosphate, 3'-diphosphate pyrophosphatase n=1 Tax=Novosphingobium kunmingense TaxID=1211806 RepID=A0A2N0H756_9SPHN|nr:Ppx/GppA phosphatase family protein [Novosphingobium kunmingense]PKB14768.1 exopolyphosphatase/guanosine-5'-triphosphate,3'-diphosphate pyrophosphatase [Novosphingobium kunmingense]
MADTLPPAMREENDTGPDDQPDGRDEATGNAPADSSASRPGGHHPISQLRGDAQGGTLPFHRQAFAAIDLGTNNCRLLIARPQGENFVVIDAFSRVVRLGEGLAQAGRLSDAAMDRALGALTVCADKLRRRNVHLARSVATEACRRASNGEAFIERVHRETGIRLDIISAKEEARLAVLGCHLLLEQGEGPAMIFDIGGGSTEMVLVESVRGEVPRIHDWQSVPWGVVSLTETCGPEPDSAEARAARYARMRELVRDSLAPFTVRVWDRLEAERKRDVPLRLLGTSGTVTTLASVHLDLPQYDRRAVDGLIVPAESMRGIASRLSGMEPAQRRGQPCIGRERSDLVIAGCAILETILDIWPADRLGVADRGIREGILRSLMAANGAAEKSRAALRRARRESALR